MMKTVAYKEDLQAYFEQFRDNIIGINQEFDSPYGKRKIVYADWTASGRLYQPIEDTINNKIAPFVANTHTETNITGCAMTTAYYEAKRIIKQHVNADKRDVLIATNSGMTGVVNKFQRILGLKMHERFSRLIKIPETLRPVVFVTHMEHHSNHTTWLETICDVVQIAPCGEGKVDLDCLVDLLEEYKYRKTKIAAVTSCSNVTGVKTPYHKIAKIMHQHGGLCFVDFACSAPYIDIDMHPTDKEEALDAIYFSPHKFLGGPSSSGVLIFQPHLYKNKIPDNPGGGTVDWTDPWGGHKYIDEIEAREDGGTPAFLQTIRTALAMKLKEKMNVSKILEREEELLDIFWKAVAQIPNLHVLADNIKNRLGVLSFYIDGLHYHLGVKILNDRFGIQVRGGCSCAGTYGHYLLNVSEEHSHKITSRISFGDLSDKPGWIRLSIHPTTSDAEMYYIVDALEQLAENHYQWAKDYVYNPSTNEFYHEGKKDNMSFVKEWFDL